MFFERLGDSILKKKSKLCLGIDPQIDRLPQPLQKILLPTVQASFLVRYCQQMIDLAQHHVAAVKFQAAYFERYGNEGLTALKEAILYARTKHLPVILDVKRGDIASTMQAYGQACFEFLQADAMTVLPYMGLDTLLALKKWLDQGRGCYCVLISSNPSGWSLQKHIIHELYTQVHQQIPNCGFVVGATIMDLIPSTIWQRFHDDKVALLCPGLGTQTTEFNTYHRDLLNQPQPHLFPISRAISQPSTAELESLQQKELCADLYWQLVEQHITQFSHQMRIS